MGLGFRLVKTPIVSGFLILLAGAFQNATAERVQFYCEASYRTQDYSSYAEMYPTRFDSFRRNCTVRITFLPRSTTNPVPSQTVIKSCVVTGNMVKNGVGCSVYFQNPDPANLILKRAYVDRPLVTPFDDSLKCVTASTPHAEATIDNGDYNLDYNGQKIFYKYNGSQDTLVDTRFTYICITPPPASF